MAAGYSRLYSLLAAALLGFACALACDSDSTSPKVERRLAIIETSGDPVRVIVADTVARDTRLPVTVTTYGDGCFSKGETEVAVNGLFALVEPYDYVEMRSGCVGVLRVFTHEASVQFAEAGTATVRVMGRRTWESGVLSVDFTVVVQ
jgi:hypothetical protein